MAASLHTVAVVLVAALLTACSHPAASHAAPLVRESNTPSRPPTVALVVGSRVVQRGVLYTTDWSTARVVAMQSPQVPVPWPGPRSINFSYGAAISLDTFVIPDFVTVSAFTRVIKGTGIPAGAPVATYECGHFTEPHCDLSATGSGLTLRRLANNLFTAGYLTVFCSWHVARAEHQATPNAPDDATASWLFHTDPAAQGAP